MNTVRKIERFNYVYESKGGFTKLSEMVAETRLYTEIAVQFGVSKTSVKDWVKKFFPQTDTRAVRRSQSIEKMIEFMKNNSEYESKKAFRGSNSGYLKEALFLAYKLGIYKNQEENGETPNSDKRSPVTSDNQVENQDGNQT